MKNVLPLVFLLSLFNNATCQTQNNSDTSQITTPNYPCEEGQIKVVEDKFTGDTEYISNYILGSSSGYPRFSYYKAKGAIYLRLKVLSTALSLGEQGVILLLASGNKLHFPSSKVNVDAAKPIGSYEYSSLIQLSLSDIKTLKTDKITDVRLYIYDGSVHEYAQKQLQDYLICISQK